MSLHHCFPVLIIFLLFCNHSKEHYKKNLEHQNKSLRTSQQQLQPQLEKQQAEKQMTKLQIDFIIKKVFNLLIFIICHEIFWSGSH